MPKKGAAGRKVKTKPNESIPLGRIDRRIYEILGELMNPTAPPKKESYRIPRNGRSTVINESSVSFRDGIFRQSRDPAVAGEAVANQNRDRKGAIAWTPATAPLRSQLCSDAAFSRFDAYSPPSICEKTRVSSVLIPIRHLLFAIQ
ncbi:MAG: hypothetical protein JNG88_11600 [Phycisphaerales bacterium]|nr:hypothetical protein [Phycisphaerales bacterium]